MHGRVATDCAEVALPSTPPEHALQRDVRQGSDAVDMIGILYPDNDPDSEPDPELCAVGLYFIAACQSDSIKRGGNQSDSTGYTMVHSYRSSVQEQVDCNAALIRPPWNN